ncbi:hypothetical protein [Rhodococcus zopfii]|uniref:hypothetical protein n=1 Tax=Rhodococcus zopfii TaxID=43772 RepID=UPI000B194F2E|nr:hypothetical protein [Rhodococcus zopfii]
MSIRKLGLTAVAAIAVVTACSNTGGESTPDAGTGVNHPDATSEVTTSAEPATAKFGEAFTFRNGLGVAVSVPQPFTPSVSAAGLEPGDQAVVFTITIVNGSTENYDPALFSTSLQSGNREASEIFDTPNNVGGSPSTAVLPGRESEFQVAYSVTNPTDLVMQVSPGFEYRDAIFTF